MNNCILMAEITQAPQLRYTADTQMAVAELVVEFPAMRPEEPPSSLKVVGWGNLAQEIKETYQVGDRVILEGRLGMNTIEVTHGANPSYKEKRAELTVQRIHKLELGIHVSSNSSTPSTEVPPSSSNPSLSVSPPKNQGSTSNKGLKSPATEVMTEGGSSTFASNLDDIPF